MSENTLPDCYGKYDRALSRARECGECTEIRACNDIRHGRAPAMIPCQCDELRDLRARLATVTAGRDKEVEARVCAQQSVADAFREMKIHAPIVPLYKAVRIMVLQHQTFQAEVARLRDLLREAENPCHMVMGDLGKRIKAELEAKP